MTELLALAHALRLRLEQERAFSDPYEQAELRAEIDPAVLDRLAPTPAPVPPELPHVVVIDLVGDPEP